MSNATRILIALCLGLVLGTMTATINTPLANQIADGAEPIGGLWLNGLRMTIVPLVVALLITGIAQTAQAAKAGRIAGLSLCWIIGVMTMSAVLGAVLTPLFLSIIPMPTVSADALKAALTSVQSPSAVPPLGDFVRALIPTNPIAAAANDAILPLMIFTTIFAFALTKLAPDQRKIMTDFFAALSDTMLIIIDWVLRLAPIGVFALAFVVGARASANALGALLHYVITVSAVGAVIALLAYPLARFGGKIALLRYARNIAPAQALAISTQSSLACLPLMVKKSIDLGVKPATAEVTLPMAVALLRATGPAMNLAVALYVANLAGVELSPSDYAIAIFAATLTSMGAVSLPGTVSFMTSIVPICLAIGAPIEPLALLIAVETLPDIVRTIGNVMHDVSVTTTVARQTGTVEDRPA